MEYPYGYCGMPCALCTRFRTEGKSRCPGCSHDGYYTETCKAHHCCRDRAIGHCGACGEFPCAKLGKMTDFRDLNTNHAKERTCEAVASSGFVAWYAEYAERAALLTDALREYNDGRMKRFLCELFIQRDLQTLRQIMRRAEGITGDQKEKGRAFRQVSQAVLAGEPQFVTKTE